MTENELKLELLKILGPHLYRGASSIIKDAQELEKYVLGSQDKPEKAPADAVKEQGVITPSNKKVPKK